MAVQQAVDELLSKNVTRIVALTHIGYDKDIELAQKTRGVDLVGQFRSSCLVDTYQSSVDCGRSFAYIVG